LKNMTELIANQREVIKQGKITEDAALARQNKLTRAWEQAQDALAALWEEQGMKVVDILNHHLIPALEWTTKKVDWLREEWNALSEDAKKSYLIWGTAGLLIFGFSEKLLALVSVVGKVGGAFSTLGKWMISPEGLGGSIKTVGMKFANLGKWMVSPTGLVGALGKAKIAMLSWSTVGAAAAIAGIAALAAGVIWVIKKWRDYTKAVHDNNLEMVRASGFSEEFASTNANMIDQFHGMQTEIMKLQKKQAYRRRVGVAEEFIQKGDNKLANLRRDSENMAQSLAMQIKDKMKREVFLLNLGFDETKVKEIMDKIGGRTLGVEAVSKGGKAPQTEEGVFMQFSTKFLDRVDALAEPKGDKDIKIDVPGGTPVLMEKPQVDTLAVSPASMLPVRREADKVAEMMSDFSPKKSEDLLQEIVRLNRQSNDLQSRLLRKMTEPGRNQDRGSSVPRGMTPTERAVLAGVGGE
jgi:hypothetical protein